MSTLTGFRRRWTGTRGSTLHPGVAALALCSAVLLAGCTSTPAGSGPAVVVGAAPSSAQAGTDASAPVDASAAPTDASAPVGASAPTDASAPVGASAPTDGTAPTDAIAPVDASSRADASAPTGDVDQVDPGTGSITEQLADRTLPTNPAVALEGTGDLGAGILARLSSVRPTTAQARLPGEVGGPALEVTVEVENSSTATVDLSATTVDASDGTGVPANPLASQSTPVTGSLEPGGRARGTYVFSYPAERTDPARITVLTSTEAPIVLFAGNVR